MEFGESVVKFETSSRQRSAIGLDLLRTDLIQGGPDRVWTDSEGIERRHTMGKVFHSGDPVMLEHFGNAYIARYGTQILVRKEHPNSNRKIDSVMGAMLAYEARRDVLTETPKEEKPSKISTVMYSFS